MWLECITRQLFFIGPVMHSSSQISPKTAPNTGKGQLRITLFVSGHNTDTTIYKSTTEKELLLCTTLTLLWGIKCDIYGNLHARALTLFSAWKLMSHSTHLP